MAFERCFNAILTIIMLAFIAIAIDAAFQISSAAASRPGFFNFSAVLMAIPTVLSLGWFKSGLAIR